MELHFVGGRQSGRTFAITFRAMCDNVPILFKDSNHLNSAKLI